MRFCVLAISALLSCSERATVVCAHQLRILDSHGKVNSIPSNSKKNNPPNGPVTSDNVEIRRRLLYDPECVGDTLSPGQRLQSGQALCDNQEKPTKWFGLDTFGSIGIWSRGVELYSTVTYWSPFNPDDGPDYKMHFLTMQDDGNLVVYKRPDSSDEDDKTENTPVWATDCSFPGSRLETNLNGPGSLIQVVGPDDNVVWKVYENGEESDCFPSPDAESPEPSCFRALTPVHTLRKNQYVCGNNGSNSKRRFGLNSRGRLDFWDDKQSIWSPGYKERGFQVKIQEGDGNLVLRTEDGTPVWSSGCIKKAEDKVNRLRFSGNDLDVKLQGGTVLWSLYAPPKSGEPFESVCYPRRECEGGASTDETICRVRMIDHLNVHYTVLEVEELGSNKYLVKDLYNDCDGHESWEVSVDMKANGQLKIDAGVPHATCNRLMNDKHWIMHDDSQLTFSKDPDYPVCSQFGKNLVYFMIQEWFYFG